MEKILYLTLKKKWFDMIESGIKTEEYREIKPYWTKRLCKEGTTSPQNGKYDVVEFRNGYQKDCPKMTFELENILIGCGKQEWGAENNVVYYVLKLGKRL